MLVKSKQIKEKFYYNFDVLLKVMQTVTSHLTYIILLLHQCFSWSYFEKSPSKFHLFHFFVQVNHFFVIDIKRSDHTQIRVDLTPLSAKKSHKQ